MLLLSPLYSQRKWSTKKLDYLSKPHSWQSQSSNPGSQLQSMTSSHPLACLLVSYLLQLSFQQPVWNSSTPWHCHDPWHGARLIRTLIEGFLNVWPLVPATPELNTFISATVCTFVQLTCWPQPRPGQEEAIWGVCKRTSREPFHHRAPWAEQGTGGWWPTGMTEVLA